MNAEREELLRLERKVADALTARDPAAAHAAIANDGDWSEALRDALASPTPDGIRMSALLVARLRFERLVQGSSHAGDWFERDPAGFAGAFRRYHAAVPPRAFLAAGEARAFKAWLDAPPAC